MFQMDTTDRRIIYRRPTGRLMRPSDRMIAGHGLGEVDGIIDTLKNFGGGLVKSLTAGIYDPMKNRFYVPGSGGQVRNWMQGVTNTATLGLVQTDKFFGSQTMRTVGNIGAGIQAAVVAGALTKYGMQKFGSPSTGAGTPSVSTVANVAKTTGSMMQAPGGGGSGPAPSSSTPILDTVDKSLKVLDLGSRIIGGATGATAPQQQGGAPGVMIVNQPSGTPYDPSMQYLMQPGGGVMYPPPGGEMSFGPGMSVPGPAGYSGGGGFGPPGSEYMTDPAMAQQQGLVEESSMMPKIALVVGVGVVAYFLIK